MKASGASPKIPESSRIVRLYQFSPLSVITLESFPKSPLTGAIVRAELHNGLVSVLQPSMLHTSLHPSPLTKLPSSHASVPETIPSPQTDSVQNPLSVWTTTPALHVSVVHSFSSSTSTPKQRSVVCIVQITLQLLVAPLLTPRSHCSDDSTIPLPQTGEFEPDGRGLHFICPFSSIPDT